MGVGERGTRPRVDKLRVPNLSEINFAKLRTGRLAGLQTMMKHRDLPLCLFFHPANIRYATGTDVMGVWNQHVRALLRGSG